MAGLCVLCRTQGFAHDSQLSHILSLIKLKVCVCVSVCAHTHVYVCMHVCVHVYACV